MPFVARETIRGRMDWTLVWATVALLFMGTLAVASASWHLPYSNHILQKHFLALGIGAFAFLAGLSLNYQVYQDQSKAAYVVAILLLLAVLIFGQTLRGTRGWFRLPFFSFQPSEVVRILTIFVVANYLVHRGRWVTELPVVIGTFALAAPVLALILAEPDLSSTLVLFPTLLCMLFCAGARPSHLSALAGYGLVSFAMPLVWTYLSLRPERTASGLGGFLGSLSHFSLTFFLALAGFAAVLAFLYWFHAKMRFQLPWYYFAALYLVLAGGLSTGILVNHALKDYQKKRFVSFLSPEADPRGSGYNLRQAQIALGSGGFWGKGMFSGTQSQLGFLPERHTDFVFAVIGEELGFLGALFTLGLYLFVLWRLVMAARVARDEFGYLVACGLTGLFGFHLLINTGMTVGLLPVAGVPLPMVSYGGSSLVVSLWSLGIAQSVYMRRFML